MAARYALGPAAVSLGPVAPSGLGAAANVGGGTFAAATYFWKVTGLTSAGETTGSNEASVAVALNGTATLTWSALPAGTTGVKVYRGTASNAENVLVATLGAVVTYTDTGTAGSAGSPPAASTAYTATDSVVTGSLRDSASTTVLNDAAGFTAAVPVAGVGAMTGILAAYLATYPSGPQL